VTSSKTISTLEGSDHQDILEKFNKFDDHKEYFESMVELAECNLVRPKQEVKSLSASRLKTFFKDKSELEVEKFLDCFKIDYEIKDSVAATLYTKSLDRRYHEYVQQMDILDDWPQTVEEAYNKVLAKDNTSRLYRDMQVSPDTTLLSFQQRPQKRRRDLNAYGPSNHSSQDGNRSTNLSDANRWRAGGTSIPSKAVKKARTNPPVTCELCKQDRVENHFHEWKNCFRNPECASYNPHFRGRRINESDESFAQRKREAKKN